MPAIDTSTDKVPLTIAKFIFTHYIPCSYPLVVLWTYTQPFHGSTFSFSPPDVIQLIFRFLKCSTVAGTFSSNEQVTLHHMVMPGFGSIRILMAFAAQDYHTRCPYEMINRPNVLCHFRLQLDSANDHINGPNIARPMRCLPSVTSS
jgi:hypothetical protein